VKIRSDPFASSAPAAAPAAAAVDLLADVFSAPAAAPAMGGGMAGGMGGGMGGGGFDFGDFSGAAPVQQGTGYTLHPTPLTLNSEP